MKTKNGAQPEVVDPRGAAAPLRRTGRTVYHLKVHILNISPMIYRRFIIDGNTHIAELHHLIQMIMGWENQHLHVFHIWGMDYGIPYAGQGYYRDDPARFLSEI